MPTDHAAIDDAGLLAAIARGDVAARDELVRRWWATADRAVRRCRVPRRLRGECRAVAALALVRAATEYRGEAGGFGGHALRRCRRDVDAAVRGEFHATPPRASWPSFARLDDVPEPAARAEGDGGGAVERAMAVALSEGERRALRPGGDRAVRRVAERKLREALIRGEGA